MKEMSIHEVAQHKDAHISPLASPQLHFGICLVLFEPCPQQGYQDAIPFHSTPNHIFSVVALSLICVTPISSRATDAACKPILDANKVKFSAPAFHDKMYDSHKAKTPTGEFIKVGDKAWMKAGLQWMAVPPAMLKKMQNFDAASFGMHNCKSLGMIGIRPAKLYGWDLKVAGKLYTGSKLTVAYDGHPTKVETPEGAYTLTSYNNVVAPAGK